MNQSIPTKDISPGPVKQFEPDRIDVMERIDLYQKRRKIHARAISGFFQNIREFTLWGMLAIYFVLPWFTWNDRQALLFDLPNRHFYVFGLTFLPQDFIFLSWLLIIAAFALFVVTVFAGRVYCGYACPQTAWTRVFMWFEELLEGDRNARLRMDKAPMSVNKFWRRGSKHAIWLAIALATGFSFVGYFTPIRDLTVDLVNVDMNAWAVFWMGLFTAFTYMNAGWMREQVCMYMCPYGRFQSVMFDRDTLIISYDTARGEPRGSRKRGADHKEAGLGDCIDCQLCVQVCPTGIDIRNGLQFECIACAACIDACDSIMDQMGYDRGLVRYTTEHALEGGKTQLLRPRLIGYAAIIGAMALMFLFALGTRVPLYLEVLRDRNQLYRENSEGLVENVYTIKLANKSQQPQDIVLSLNNDVGVKLALLGKAELHLDAGAVETVPLTVQADPGELSKSRFEIEFEATSKQDKDVKVKRESRFIGPASL